MTPQMTALAGTLLAAAWAALLALAEGSLNAEPRLAAAVRPRWLAERPERLRRALTLGRITLLALTSIALAGAVRWWASPFHVALGKFALLAVGIAVAADLLPRFVGLLRAASVGPWAVRVAGATLAVGTPLFVAAGVVDDALTRLFGVATPRPHGSDLAQREMLLGVFALADTMVTEVMTPRVDIVGLDVRASFEEAVHQVAGAAFSRLPVFEEDLDHIVGVLYAKELLPARFGEPGSSEDWHSLIKPVEIVPEVKTLDQQLRDFQRGTSHLAVVVDEFGGTAGIVTLEDVLEEIVGEIEDEYDEADHPPVREAAPGVFAVEARAQLDELAEVLGVPLEHEEVTTAGGFVYAALGHVPVPGESVDVPGYRIVVERVERRSIRSLRFERLPEDGE